MGVNEKGGRLIGYARVSTEDQNLEMQIAALKKAGVHPNHIHVEKVSASATRRRVLDLVLRMLRENDTLVVWKLDRIARSMQDMLTKMETIKGKGVRFLSLTEQIDTSTPGGVFLFHMLAAAAQLERDLIRQRTRAGVEAAKARGVQFGQPKKVQSKAIVRQMRAWRKERPPVPYRTIRERLKQEHKLDLSITTIEKYVSGKVKL